MNREELKEYYEDGRLDSTSVLQNLRQPIREITGMNVPERPADVEQWWKDNKPTFARKLNGDDEDQDKTEQDDEETDDQSEDNQ